MPSQLIKEICLRNLLSFGAETIPLALKQLNVLIGPNGSGKSNFLDALTLLRAAPGEIASTVRDGGGIGDWLWKGLKRPTASLQVTVTLPKPTQSLRYLLEFTESRHRIEVTNERIENAEIKGGEKKPYFYFGYENGHPMLNLGGKSRRLQREDVDPEKSILAQRRDPDQYPEITNLARRFEKIRVYRSWAFGRHASGRDPQVADAANDFLDDGEAEKQPFGSNLGLMLNRLMLDSEVRSQVLDRLKAIYADIEDIRILTQAGRVQVFLIERGISIPATRLSDGTLRFLCLLTIFCNPKLPPLVCVDEPELGLHPDALVAVASLLKDASRRSQIIVTTHSKVIVDALTESPEDIVVCEKVDGCTRMTRLVAGDLKVWLTKYSLGELWRKGELGGNRW